MKKLDYKKIREMSGHELYLYAVGVIKLVKEDVELIAEWQLAERKRWFWQKKIQKPKLKFVSIYQGEWENDWVTMHISASFLELEETIKYLNHSVLSGDGISEFAYKSHLLPEVLKINKVNPIDENIIKDVIKTFASN